ncbi:hypothetical protein [Bifidobacterium sp. UBA6881]|uniref:hypothetical protein n=1 Tax=Bifidobacterium sp. UBA6881 TaxID=1946109 RepID=UPI000EE06B21|nr:hypothetical protein [Bifidobacterium sp. UBA6881]HAH52994.1 hypothetical protein [Bifidobacterium sp.]HCA74053.1 hypothetical protein [Bifidobacterium sp.]HCH21310.1 hypothetical protein [Bifidobacterium sp.]
MDAPLFEGNDLPGPMCLNLLSDSSTLCKLNDDNAYSLQDASTLFGRASIIAPMLPGRSVACAGTAAWVWLGGIFPEAIDIIARSHYRAARYGLKINVFNRRTLSKHVTQIGLVNITTPARTACDLALNCTAVKEPLVGEIVCMLMQEFRFRPDECLRIMEESKHTRNACWARKFFLTLEGRAG